MPKDISFKKSQNINCKINKIIHEMTKKVIKANPKAGDEEIAQKIKIEFAKERLKYSELNYVEEFTVSSKKEDIELKEKY